jgi:hypothetical protein
VVKDNGVRLGGLLGKPVGGHLKETKVKERDLRYMKGKKRLSVDERFFVTGR